MKGWQNIMTVLCSKNYRAFIFSIALTAGILNFGMPASFAEDTSQTESIASSESDASDADRQSAEDVLPDGSGQQAESTEASGTSASAASKVGCSSDTGCEPYAKLMGECTETVRLDSVVSTVHNVTLYSGDVLQNKKFVSTADQDPILYLEDGFRWSTYGEYSNALALFMYEQKDIVIENCIFENCYGLQMHNCENIVIRNCYFKGYEVGAYMQGSSNITIENCTFYANDTHLPSRSQGIYINHGNNGINIRNCHFISENLIGKAVRVGAAYDSVTTENVTVENCLIEGNYISAMQFIDDDGRTLIKNCTFDLGGDDLVVALMESNKAKGSTVENCLFTGQKSYIITRSKDTVLNGCETKVRSR